MSETINELYLKYIDAVSSLEDDRYFRYLFEIIQSGNHVLQQNRQVLHKVVDETWLTVIEDSLDALNTIIEKPRRFVATTEEVVPVSLAKKITAHSVRHLSMNTQFIASNENGEIQPTRVLNMTQEDSYDLYENRFIYHLIQKLVVFIDKRTDVLFWSTGDEIRNTMVLESKIDDAYEEIEYKIEMKVKNRQSFAENDADNMDVFMRIDRVRRMTMALRGSAFCELMSGCAKVRSPIQRTNLLMKDPNYRKCYQLWQFLESYEEVGYTIEEQNAALEFDEEYLIQVYINLIANYAVFKSLTDEVEDRNLDELSKAFHQVLKPKFVKQIREEIVDDYNIPDVEIRKVIVEEVTQAQLDAEAKLAEETALREQAEVETRQAMDLSQQYLEQMTAAQEQAALAEAMQAAAEQARDASEAAKAAAEEQLAAVTAEKVAAQERCRAAESDRDHAHALARDAEQAKQAAEAARSQAEQDAAAADRARLDAETARDAALLEKESAVAAESAAKTAMDSAVAALSVAQSNAAEAVSARMEAERRQAEAEKAMAEALSARAESRKAQLDAEVRSDADREAKALADRARDAALREKQQALRAAEQANRAAADANEKAAACDGERMRLDEQLKAALAAMEEAQQACTAAEKARRDAESRAEAHRAAQERAEAAAQEAALAKKAAEDARAETAKREMSLREQLLRCEKKLAKAKKRLESTKPWPWIPIGRK